jgi:hypothetical protein
MAKTRRTKNLTAKPKLTGVILEREFELSKGRRKTKVYVRFGRPRRTRDGRQFSCIYRIDGLGQAVAHRTHGVDSIQALDLAMKMAMADLVSSDEYTEGRLTWIGIHDLGLPMMELLRERLQKDAETDPVTERKLAEMNAMRDRFSGWSNQSLTTRL